MSGVDLAILKAHVSATDFTDDDVLLQRYLDASEAQIAAYLRRDLDSEFLDGWPEPVQQAVLLLAAIYYERGDAVTDMQGEGMPAMVKSLLASFRDLS